MRCRVLTWAVQGTDPFSCIFCDGSYIHVPLEFRCEYKGQQSRKRRNVPDYLCLFTRNSFLLAFEIFHAFVSNFLLLILLSLCVIRYSLISYPFFIHWVVLGDFPASFAALLGLYSV